MKTCQLMFVITLLLFDVGLIGCIDIATELTESFEYEYVTTDDTVLSITNQNGRIEINNWDGNTVILIVTKRTHHGRDEFDNIEIINSTKDSELTIETNYTTEKVRVSVDMDIMIPDTVTVAYIETSNGDILLTGTKGNTTALSSNGDIIANNIDGYVMAKTSNGRIDIRSTTGVNDISTSNGDIITEIFEFKESIDIESSNGNIIIYINPSLNADILMITSNGKVMVEDLILDFLINDKKHKEGRLGNGGNTINIHSSNGDVKLKQLIV